METSLGEYNDLGVVAIEILEGNPIQRPHFPERLFGAVKPIRLVMPGPVFRHGAVGQMVTSGPCWKSGLTS